MPYHRSLGHFKVVIISFLVSGCAFVFGQDKKGNSCAVEASNMGSERQFFVGGNWKMNGTRREIEDLLKNLEKSDLDTEVRKWMNEI